MPTKTKPITRLIVNRSDAVMTFVSNPTRLGVFDKVFSSPRDSVKLSWLDDADLSGTDDPDVFHLDLPGHLEEPPKELVDIGITVIKRLHMVVNHSTPVRSDAMAS